MAEKIKNLVINFDANGKFASATQQKTVFQKIDGVTAEIPQPNEPVDLAGILAILKEA